MLKNKNKNKLLLKKYSALTKNKGEMIFQRNYGCVTRTVWILCTNRQLSSIERYQNLFTPVTRCYCFIFTLFIIKDLEKQMWFVLLLPMATL